MSPDLVLQLGLSKLLGFRCLPGHCNRQSTTICADEFPLAARAGRSSAHIGAKSYSSNFRYRTFRKPSISVIFLLYILYSAFSS
jgi:hypothetical protein